jgi:hypothetical protein
MLFISAPLSKRSVAQEWRKSCGDKSGKPFFVIKFFTLRVMAWGLRGKYTTENFSMYGGETERVTIQFSNAMAGVVIAI